MTTTVETAETAGKAGPLLFAVTSESGDYPRVSSLHRTWAGAEAALRRYIAEIWAKHERLWEEEIPADLDEAIRALEEVEIYYRIEAVNLDD